MRAADPSADESRSAASFATVDLPSAGGISSRRPRGDTLLWPDCMLSMFSVLKAVLVVFRPHGTHGRPIDAAYILASMVYVAQSVWQCQCVLCVGHTGGSCKNEWTDREPTLDVDSRGVGPCAMSFYTRTGSRSPKEMAVVSGMTSNQRSDREQKSTENYNK